MLKIATMFLTVCAVSLSAGSLLADDGASERRAGACCGAAPDEKSLRSGAFVRRSSAANDIEGCICLKYIHTIWGDGTCSFYATDCFNSPFNWDDFCDQDMPQSCEFDESGTPIGCGTCLYFPSRPAPRASVRDQPLARVPDHTISPDPQEDAGASFFDEPFFVRVAVGETESPIKAKVFPILVQRRVIVGRTLSAQVFYLGVEIKDFPPDVKPRPVHGEAAGRYQCRVIDHEKVLQIRTRTEVSGR